MADLYEDIVLIVTDYLGPAGQRFVDRQIVFHLKIKPQEITKKDVPSLVEWIKVTLALLTEDAEVIKNCIDRISKLAK